MTRRIQPFLFKRKMQGSIDWLKLVEKYDKMSWWAHKTRILCQKLGHQSRWIGNKGFVRLKKAKCE